MLSNRSNRRMLEHIIDSAIEVSMFPYLSSKDPVIVPKSVSISGHEISIKDKDSVESRKYRSFKRNQKRILKSKKRIFNAFAKVGDALDKSYKTLGVYEP